MEVISVYRNDVLPDLEVEILDFDVETGEEVPRDLSAVGVVVHLKTRPKAGGSLKIDSTLTPVDAALGQFKYTWLPIDNNTADVYTGEISIEFPPVPTIVNRGDWSAVETYVANDVVTNAGSTWLAKVANTNSTPVEGAKWTLYVPRYRTIMQFELNVLEDLQ